MTGCVFLQTILYVKMLVPIPKEQTLVEIPTHRMLVVNNTFKYYGTRIMRSFCVRQAFFLHKSKLSNCIELLKRVFVGSTGEACPKVPVCEVCKQVEPPKCEVCNKCEVCQKVEVPKCEVCQKVEAPKCEVCEKVEPS